MPINSEMVENLINAGVDGRIDVLETYLFLVGRPPGPIHQVPRAEEFWEVLDIMLCFCNEGYLLGSKFREPMVALPWITCLPLLFLSFVLWTEVFSESPLQLIYLVGAIGITTWLVFLLISWKHNLSISNMRYSCHAARIVNHKGDCSISVDLSNSFFVSEIAIPFRYGKASTSVIYFLFSAKPLETDYSGYYGSKAIDKLFENHICLIPSNEDTERWVLSITNQEHIPAYPKVMGCPHSGNR